MGKNILSNVKYVITGMPRSGTGYMAQLFSSGGIPCGHERIFTPGGISPNKYLVADSSWLAVPHLRKVKQAQIIHIIRDPIKVINSMYVRGIGIRGNVYDKFIEQWLPDIKKINNRLDKLLYFYIHWNKKIEYFKPEQFNVKKITDSPSVFFEDLKIQTGLKKLFSNNKYNSMIYEDQINWSDIQKSEFFDEFASMVIRYNKL